MKSHTSYPKVNCPKIEHCDKVKTHDFFRLTCTDDYEICNVFDGAIDFGSKNRTPREWMMNEDKSTKWWLISDEDVQVIKKGLTDSLLHTLESGLHVTNEVPEDWK